EDATAAHVRDDVFGQLKATGMSDEEASANAAVMAARYATRAQRLGGKQTAAELYQGEGLSVRGEGGALVPKQRGAAVDLKARATELGDQIRVVQRSIDNIDEQVSLLPAIEARLEWLRGGAVGDDPVAGGKAFEKVRDALDR